MQKVEKLYSLLIDGELDEMLTARYGKANLERQKARFEHTLSVFGKTYDWTRRVNVYGVPYSVVLTGDGSDLAIATDLDAVAVSLENGVNVTRFQARDYFGEDNVDLYQHGPYEIETDKTAGVVRGVLQAFLHFGYEVFGIDCYIDADTLPESGLSDPAHLATAIAVILNERYNGGKLSENQLALAVQWALENYILMDSVPAGVIASIRGESVIADYSNPDAPVISNMKPNMCGCSLFTVNTDLIKPDLNEDEIDSRLEKIISKLGKPLEDLTEKEFYSSVSALDKDCDKQAVLFLMDYYTQENLSKIYEANVHGGIGCPSTEPTLSFLGKDTGGASKWRNHIRYEHWMTLCCVSMEAQPEFAKSMAALFSDTATTELGFASEPARVILPFEKPKAEIKKPLPTDDVNFVID